jgi:hypothetical protein
MRSRGGRARQCPVQSAAKPGAPVPQPPYITICALKVPTHDDWATIGAREPARELAAALGHLLHFAALSAKYLGLPLLHESGFKARSECPLRYLPLTPVILSLM